MLGAYAVVGKSNIWASTRIRGTYFLDTESGTWSKAMDSPVPFSGRAEYAPEHGLWFGFPTAEWQPQRQPRHWDWDNGLLGAWDLNSAKAGGAAVPLLGCDIWEGFETPSGSSNVRSHLLHLGDGGRFCVAKLYQTTQPLPAWACPRCYNDGVPVDIRFAVFTGVEVERHFRVARQEGGDVVPSVAGRRRRYEDEEEHGEGVLGGENAGEQWCHRVTCATLFVHDERRR